MISAEINDHAHNLMADEAAMTSWIELKEELLVLGSVYCGNRELVIYPECSDDHPSFPVTLKLTVPVHHECAPVITLVIELTILSSYPTTPPAIKLSSSDFETSRLELAAHDHASSLVPHPSLLDVITFIKEAVQNDITTSLSDDSSVTELSIRGQARYKSSFQTTGTLSTANSPSLTTSSSSSPSMNFCLVRLEHMRSEAHYLGILRKWAYELNVFCHVANAGPHRVFVLLKGTEEDVHEFLKRWRTSSVDVDKRGKPCKEKLMSVLYQGITSQPLSEG